MASDDLAKRLQALSIINEALKSENEELRHQLHAAGDADLEEELSELKAEFTQRLEAAEKMIINLKAERESLLKRLDVSNKSAEEHAQQLHDKDAAMSALRAEGDELSRKQGDLERAARKLRASLKDCETQRDELRAKAESLEAEAQNRQLIVQASTEEVHNETLRLQREVAEREAALLASAEAHAARLASLQATLAALEARSAAREDALRSEVARLERRCQEAEAARDDIAASNAEATLPLMRELEAVTAAAARASDAAADTESRLMTRAAESALLSAETAERRARAHASAAESSNRDAVARAAALTEKLATATSRLDDECARSEAIAVRLQEEIAARQAAVASVAAAEARVQSLQHDKERATKALAEAQKAWHLREAELLSRVSELQASLIQAGEAHTAQEAALQLQQAAASSPLPAPTSDEPPLGAPQNALSRPGEAFELRRQLKLLEEARRHDARMLLQAEERAQSLSCTAAEYARVKQELKTLQEQHATALELLGERNDRVDELEMDLLEARAIYRSQILMLCPNIG